MAKIGIILGSGLDKFKNELTGKTLLYQDIIGVHKKEIFSGLLSNIPLVVFSGRRHLYENKDMNKVLFNIQKAKEYGIELLIITNAAGGLNPDFKVTDLMLITSHINLMFFNQGKMSKQFYYDRKIAKKVKEIAKLNNIKLHSGVYCALPGPSYETKSEIKFERKYHADAAGMSTVPELYYAADYGIKTIAISCITNVLNPEVTENVNHEEVLDAGVKAYKNFSKLLKLIAGEFGK